MNEGSKDLFGKIDALFEKRAPDVLVDKGLEHEDFPVLTEIIGKEPPSASPSVAKEKQVPTHDGEERRQADRRGHDRRLGDRRLAHPPAEPPNRPVTDKPELERLVETVELRLSDLFIRQQLRLEEVVRKVVREEMDKNLGHASNQAGGNQRDA
jgi:hypothetical protein